MLGVYTRNTSNAILISLYFTQICLLLMSAYKSQTHIMFGQCSQFLKNIEESFVKGIRQILVTSEF